MVLITMMDKIEVKVLLSLVNTVLMMIVMMMGISEILFLPIDLEI